MTILKAGIAGPVPRYRTAPPLLVEVVPSPPPVDPLVERLSERVAALEAELAVVRRDAIGAVADAREEGAREVLLDERDRLEAVQAGLAAAHGALTERLDRMESLAVSIARAAVGRMLGEHGDLGMLVERSAAAYVRRVGAHSIVRLRVSPLDFPEADLLARASGAAGLPSEMLVADAMLGPGECRAELKLGHADLDLGKQWAEIERVLDAAPDRAACADA